MDLLVLLCLTIAGQTVMATGVSGQVCINGTLRLFKIPSQYIDGYFVQYCHNRQWRFLCTGDNRWQSRHATVVCRQLGYNGIYQRGRRGLSSENSTFFRIAPNCTGAENSIQKCGPVQIINESGLPQCDKETTGQGGQIFYAWIQCLACTEGEIRLVSGATIGEGRVEVCIGGRWGTVHSNNQQELAGTVCTRLGFPAAGAQAVSTHAPGFVQLIRNCTVGNGNSLNCTELCDASCNHTMDLGVVCITHEKFAEMKVNKTLGMCAANISRIDEMLQRCTSEAKDAEHLPSTAQPESLGTTTPALGAVIGVLVVVLLIGAVGWILTCLKLGRSSNPRRKSTARVQINGYPLQQAVYDQTTHTRNNYSSVGPNYDLVTSNTEDLDTYADVIGHNQQTPPTVQLAPLTPEEDEATKKEDDFYEPDEHTYAMVNEKPKAKKKATDVGKGERGDLPVYESVLPGETSWGVQEEEEGYSKLKR